MAVTNLILQLLSVFLDLALLFGSNDAGICDPNQSQPLRECRVEETTVANVQP